MYNIIKLIMKLLNKLLIGFSCVFFALYFAITMLILAICYFFKFIYYKSRGKGDFNINPLKHADPDVMGRTSTFFIIQSMFSA